MVDAEPMPLEVLVGLVQLVKRGHRWPTKGAVVLQVGAQVGGGWVTSEDLADTLPIQASTCRVLLRELDDERVILRDAGTGASDAGGRGGVRYWCEVNPRWEDWRVSWRFPRRVIAQRVVLMAEGARKSDLERFFARSYGARYPEISARLWARETVRREAAEAAFSRVPWARETDAGGGAFRAFSGGQGRSRGGVSRVHGRAKPRPVPQERALPARAGGDDTPVSVPGPAAPKRNRGINVQRSHIYAAKRAVTARAATGRGTDRPLIFPGSSLEDRLVDLVATHGLADVVAACERVEAERYVPPMFVDQVAELLETGALPALDDVAGAGAAAPAARIPTRAEVEQRMTWVEQRIATIELDGWEVPGELVAERDELRQMLDQLGDPAAAGRYPDHRGDHPGGSHYADHAR